MSNAHYGSCNLIELTGIAKRLFTEIKERIDEGELIEETVIRQDQIHKDIQFVANIIEDIPGHSL